MASFSVKIEGLDALIKRLDKYGNTLESKVAEGVQLAAVEMTGIAKRNINENNTIVTSDLYNSMFATNEGDPLTWYSGSNVPYAAFVEFGTGYGFRGMQEAEWMDFAAMFKGASQEQNGMAPYAFLHPAYKEVEKTYKKDITKTIKDF
jgi:HK97 gp10 family phage protein